MHSVNTFLSLLKTPRKLFRPLSARGFFDWMSDETYIKCLYYSEMGTKLHLTPPVTFNEKIQWLKLHDHNPEYVSWVDKKEVKDKVAQKIGSQYVVPMIDSWSDPNEIDFDQLPEKCVLKCNHDQGSTIILDKTKSYDPTEIVRFYKKRLKKCAFRTTREWPYKRISPKIICEEFLEEDIIDYKFFCFNGKPSFVNIGQNSTEDHRNHITFVDLDWELLPFQRSDFSRVKKLPPKPNNFSEMLKIASQLAEGTYFVRIDLFHFQDKVYFSEFTLYPTSGLIKFDPIEFDQILGKQLIIEREKK